MAGPKTRNNKTMTEAAFKSFVMSSLRRASMRSWRPIAQCLVNARVARGEYLCAECGKVVPASIRDENGKRVKFIHVDHIIPVIDPDKGFETWDKVIDRLFCEPENLAAICGDCHSKKTNEERALAKTRRERNKFIELS